MDLPSEETMSPASKLFRKVSLDFFVDFIPPKSRVLDCGAGDGGVSIPLAENGCEVDAIDFQAERIANLESAKGDLPVNGITGDFFAYPFKPVYDYVIARQFVAHFPDRWKEVILRMANLCKPSGAVIFHMHSTESAEIGKSIARSPKHRKSVEKGYPKNGNISYTELEKFAKANGMNIEKINPIMFFHPNSLFWRAGMDKDQRRNFATELDQRLLDPGACEFARWFEKKIVGAMPMGFAADFIAVLRKC